MDDFPFVAFPLMFVVMLSFQQWIGPRITKYQITDEAVEIRRFGLRRVRCIFSDILGVRTCPFWLMMFGGSVNANNRMAARGVLIRRIRRGNIINEWIILTPQNPEAFVEEVRVKVKAAKQSDQNRA